MDASNINELKFRTEIIHKGLPTMDKMVEWKKSHTDICIMCKEDFDHIWECQQNKKQLPNSVKLLKELLGDQTKKCTETKKMIDFISKDEFITTKMAKGNKELQNLSHLNIKNQKIIINVLANGTIQNDMETKKPRNI